MHGKKRLCMVMGGHFSATIGGAQYQAQCIVDELAKTGDFEIYYLTRLVDPDYRATGYAIKLITEGRRRNRRSFLFDVWPLYRILRNLRPHVIYQRGLKADTTAAALYAQRTECKMVFHIAHDDDVRPFTKRKNMVADLPDLLDKKISELGLRRAESIVAQTRRQADMLWEHYERRVTAVIGNFHPEPREAITKMDPIKVVWIANFKEAKRPECFVDLVESLQERRNIEFHMIGRPGDQKVYGGLHERMSYLPMLRYHSELPIDKVNEILAGAHIFVNTSRAEGFPNTFIQAWMREVPVVSLIVDPDDVLVNHKLGFRSGTLATMKEHVLTLVDQSQLRVDMGKRARAYALEYHSARNVEKLISLL